MQEYDKKELYKRRPLNIIAIVLSLILIICAIYLM